jgi:hypothetical protein
MAVKPEDVLRIHSFRNRLVDYASYVNGHVHRYEATPDHVARHVAEEQAWLGQEYGRVKRMIEPHGIAGMRQFGMIVSQDVIRDAIGSPTHPGYADIAQLAVQHLDVVIGELRAEVEDGPAVSPTPDVLYRLTSPLYWLGRLLAFVRWLITTNRGRITAGVSILVVAVVSGIVSGAAQAWFERFLAGP